MTCCQKAPADVLLPNWPTRELYWLRALFGTWGMTTPGGESIWGSGTTIETVRNWD